MSDDKKYGVVICPKCHYPRGVELRNAKSKCYHCSYTFKIKELNKFYETDSETELAEAVGRLNAKLQGGLEEYLKDLEEYENVTIEYEQLEPHKRIAKKLQYVTDPPERLEKLAQELSSELSEFKQTDIMKVLEELGIRGKRAENLVKSLVDNNLIYEPKAGKFKIVEG